MHITHSSSIYTIPEEWSLNGRKLTVSLFFLTEYMLKQEHVCLNPQNSAGKEEMLCLPHVLISKPSWNKFMYDNYYATRSEAFLKNQIKFYLSSFKRGYKLVEKANKYPKY